MSRYGEPLQERKLTVAEVQHRLDRYFHPYHRELSSVMDVATFKKNEGFEAIQNVACAVLQAVTQRARERIGRNA